LAVVPVAASARAKRESREKCIAPGERSV
jgi:hypothetical protein